MHDAAFVHMNDTCEQLFQFLQRHFQIMNVLIVRYGLGQRLLTTAFHDGEIEMGAINSIFQLDYVGMAAQLPEDRKLIDRYSIVLG